MNDGTCFGALVRAHRWRAGMTQRTLADLSTVSIRTIRDLERGRVGQPRQETVRLIADALRLGPKTRAELETAANRGWTEWSLNTMAAPAAAVDPLVGREVAIADLERELLLGVLVRLVGPPGVDGSRPPLGVPQPNATAAELPTRLPLSGSPEPHSSH